MDISVDQVYNELIKRPEYSSQIVKRGNKITIYSNDSIKKSEERKNKLRGIRDYLKGQFPEVSNLIIYNPKGSGSTIGRTEIINRGSRDVVVLLKPVLQPMILKNWFLNEEMFADISNEYKDYADEDSSKYKILISDGRKSIIIDDVESVTRVGGLNKKSDIKITKTIGKEYNISLKMPQFPAWQGYANSSPSAVETSKKIMKNLVNPTASFGKGSGGVSVMSTLSEVKEFCFGGDGSNKVDYIISANFTSKAPGSSFKYNQDTKTLTIMVNKIYSRTPIDYEEIRKNCYLLISKVSNISVTIGNEYRGYQISFVPESRVKNTIPGKR